MNVRSPLEATVVTLVVLVGLLIGGMLAMFTRSSNQTQQVTVASTSPSQSPPPAASPVRSTSRPPLAVVSAPVASATAPPAAKAERATPVATAMPTPVAPAASATATANAVFWRIQEANVHVGTIVWSGRGVPSGSGNAIVLDVHKVSVAGHAVSSCELHTTLHAVVNPGLTTQTVPYDEVSCSGAGSSGEMRIRTFSADGRSFTGSFWSNGSNLGDFTALAT